MIPGSANPLLLASAAGAAGGGYQIERSLRFNSADSAYLSRTPSSAGNRKTWTWAGWVKRCRLSGVQTIFSATNDNYVNNYIRVSFTNGGSLEMRSTSGLYKETSAVLEDPSAWYHIIIAVDTTNVDSEDRARVYINGGRITSWSVNSVPPLDSTPLVNAGNIPHYHNCSSVAPSTYGTELGDLYLADVHFIDGQALDPTSFGEFDTNGIWQPIEYTGTYGTNGFHLPFSNNSTAAALGTDASPQGNTWAVNNISVAAGANNDSLVDSPTNYGTDAGAGAEVRGNYCTWGAVFPGVSGLSNGNLEASVSASNAFGTISVTSGKWYWEVVGTSLSDPYVGVMDSTFSFQF